MAEGKCANCARYLLIFFNLIFWIIGMIMIGVGIWMIASEDTQQTIKSLVHLQVDLQQLSTVGYAVIGVGSFMFFIGFCGCCGAIRESAIMLGVYMIFMVVLVLGELAAIVYMIVEKSTIETIVRDQLLKDVKNYTGDASHNVNNNFTQSKNDSAMDFLQIKFACCGSEGFMDYRESYKFKDNYLKSDYSSKLTYVPDSCCVTKERKIPAKPVDRQECQMAAFVGPDTDSTNLNKNGCLTIFKGLIDDNSEVLIGVSAGIIFLEILGLVFAVLLCRNRTEYEYEYDD